MAWGGVVIRSQIAACRLNSTKRRRILLLHGCFTKCWVTRTFRPHLLVGLLALPLPSLAQPVSLGCGTTATDPRKEAMIVVVDEDRGEIKTESLLGNKPHKRMVYHIEGVNKSVVEAKMVARKNEFFLELDRVTGHVLQSVDDQEPTQFDCEAP